MDFELFFYSTWLGYMNSFMNPIIYTIFNTEFRRAFKSIIFGRKAGGAGPGRMGVRVWLIPPPSDTVIFLASLHASATFVLFIWVQAPFQIMFCLGTKVYRIDTILIRKPNSKCLSNSQLFGCSLYVISLDGIHPEYYPFHIQEELHFTFSPMPKFTYLSLSSILAFNCLNFAFTIETNLGRCMLRSQKIITDKNQMTIRVMTAIALNRF